MPNTKSAERRARSSEIKHQRNKSIKTSLKTLEKSFLGAVTGGKKDAAKAAYQDVASGLDKAAKTGVIHKRTADRKKSRLALRLNTVK